MKEEQGIVYLVTCAESGKSYVGYTYGTLDKRWKRHVYDAGRGSDVYLHRAIRKYGPAAFVIATLRRCAVSKLRKAEIGFIKSLGTLTPAGYNLTLGGDGGGYGFREEHERKAIGARIGAANKGKIQGPCSAEKKAQISMALTGRKMSAEECAAHSAGLHRRYARPEERAKTVASSRAHYDSPLGAVTRQRQSAACKRRAASGAYFSDATRALLSAKAKEQHARQREAACTI